jgi:hypothetical protein
VVCAVTATGALDLSGTSGSSGVTVAIGEVLVFNGGTLPAATQYAAYSHSLASFVSGGVPPYTYAYVSGGVNVGYGAAGANLTVTPNIPFTESVVYQVTDSTATSKTATFTIPINYVVPAGAAALGYTQLLWILINPNLSQINPGPYGSTTQNDLYNGYWGNSGASFSLFSNLSMVNGVLQAAYQQTAQTWIGTQNTNGSGPPAAGNLPWLANANGWYSECALSTTAWTTDSWFAYWLQSTEYNNAGTSGVINPAQAAYLKQWLEVDVWEAGASAGYQGNLCYHNGVSGTQGVSNYQNPSFTNPDQTQPQVYGASWGPTTGTVSWYINGVNSSSRSCLNNVGTEAGVVVNSTSLAWLNTQHMYANIDCGSHGANTPYGLNVYYLAAWGPPSGGSTPGAPTNVTAYTDPNSGTIYVRFTPPSSSGSSAITSYTATTTTGGYTATTGIVANVANGVSYNQLNARVDISGAPAGTPTTVTVYATNGSGNGSSSSASNSVTPTTLTTPYYAIPGNKSSHWGDYSYGSGAVYYGTTPGTASRVGSYTAPTNPVTSANNVVEVDGNEGLQPYILHINPSETWDGRFNLAPFTQLILSIYPTTTATNGYQIQFLKVVWVDSVTTSATSGGTLTDTNQSWPASGNFASGADVLDISASTVLSYGVTGNTATTMSGMSTTGSSGDYYEVAIPDISIGRSVIIGNGSTPSGVTGPATMTANAWNTYTINLTAFNASSGNYPTVYPGQILKFGIQPNSAPASTYVAYFANVGFQ